MQVLAEFARKNSLAVELRVIAKHIIDMVECLGDSFDPILTSMFIQHSGSEAICYFRPLD